jgi:hypothetical protein
MSGAERVRVAYELSMLAKRMMETGIRRDHPEWTDQEIKREILRRAFFPQPLPPWAP